MHVIFADSPFQFALRLIEVLLKEKANYFNCPAYWERHILNAEQSMRDIIARRYLPSLLLEDIEKNNTDITSLLLNCGDYVVVMHPDFETQQAMQSLGQLFAIEVVQKFLDLMQT